MAVDVMTTLKIGITAYEEMKARTLRIARGERGRIRPKLAHDRVELELSLVGSSVAERGREVG